MIEGVEIIKLKQISDERGKIMHMLRCDDKHFEEFGEIYFSIVYPGIVKGWHKHKKMILNYAVPFGMIKLVLFDDRQGSSTHGEIHEIFTGEDNYCLIKIPPLIWNGFKGTGSKNSIVANCASLPHDTQEIIRLNPFDNNIPYDWQLKDG